MNNTKDCIVCGSVIKQSAKKCPYCKAVQTHASYTTPHEYDVPAQDIAGRQRPATTPGRTTSTPRRPANNFPVQAAIIIVVFAIILLIGVFSVVFTNLYDPGYSSPPQREHAHTDNPIIIDEDMTDGQIAALDSAISYIKYHDYSYPGLIEMLVWNGFSHEDAVWAADRCGADWLAEAVDSAQSYVDYYAFSYVGLYDQLIYEDFTEEQAKYGADNCDADWFGEALEAADTYLRYSSFSYKALVEQLEFEGFAESEIEFAMECCEADWCAEALECAKLYLEYADFSRDELIAQLEYEGFLPEEAQYGADGALNGK